MRTQARTLVASALAAGAILSMVLGVFGAVPTAFAAAAEAGSYTQTFHDATDSFPAANPCAGNPATISMTYNGVFHVTELASGQGAGTFWATGTQAGSMIIAPTDPSLPTYTGHFAAWFGDNNNLQNGAETSTLEVQATGSDGSTLAFHDIEHLSVSATGMTIAFDKPVCG